MTEQVEVILKRYYTLCLTFSYIPSLCKSERVEHFEPMSHPPSMYIMPHKK